MRQKVPLHWNDLRARWGLVTASATGMGGILFQVDPPTLGLTIAEGFEAPFTPLEEQLLQSSQTTPPTEQCVKHTAC